MENACHTLPSQRPHEETCTSCPVGTSTQPACGPHSASALNEEFHHSACRRDCESIVVETSALKSHGLPDYPRTPIFRVGSMATESRTDPLGSRRNPFSHIFAS